MVGTLICDYMNAQQPFGLASGFQLLSGKFKFPVIYSARQHGKVGGHGFGDNQTGLKFWLCY